MKRSFCSSCCTGGVDADEDAHAQIGTEVNGGRVAPAAPAQSSSANAQPGPKFIRLSPESPWLVCRSVDHGGKLFWMHTETHETTWRQPLPHLRRLPEWPTVDPSLRASAHVVVDLHFFGAPAEPSNPKARTGICGIHPADAALRRTCETLSPEHCLYPSVFLERVGLRRYVMCEELRYNGQRRRDVPDLASGTLYIDVGDRATRRKRHSFHHELWHMVDFHLLGNQFEAHDAEWAKFNPPGFQYGSGGKHMRSDSSSSQLSSAPQGGEFMNRYATSSVAEDKAEIWAALMCYQQVLKTKALQSKAALLKKRARKICPAMDDKWWEVVVAAQRKETDHWEVHYSDSQRGKAYWCNWVTEEKRWTKPPEAAAFA